MRFPSIPGVAVAWSLICLASGPGASAKETLALPPVPELRFNTPMAAVLAVARREALDVAGVAGGIERAGIVPGDSVTVLVSLTNGDELTQWLIELRCVEPNDKERALPAVKPLVLFTSTGTTIDLGGSRAVLAVRVLGPYKGGVAEKEAGRAAKDVRQRVVVNADFLGLGFDRACESVLAVNAARKARPELPMLKWAVRQKAFSPEETEPNRKLADQLGLTPERERAATGGIPALLEFFNIMSQTPGLEDVVKSVVDVPWWELIKSGGKARVQLMPLFNLAVQRGAGDFATEGPYYALPFSLRINDKPALTGRLAAVSPRPPLLTCAGIYGVAAQSPQGNGPHLMMQVLAARLAGDPGKH